MKSLKTILQAPLIGIFLVSFSCTLIQDSDITTSDQLYKVKLKSIEIKQETSKGNNSTIAALLYDSAVKVTDPATGAKITRKMRFSLPSLGSLKMKLRSGTTVKTELYVSFKDDGQPYTFIVYQGDSIVEWYRFRYSSYTTSNSKLNKIVTILNPVDNLPEKVRTNDTLIYSTSSGISSIVRRSPDPARAATVTISYGGAGSRLSVSNFDYLSLRYQQQQSNCPNGGTSDACAGYSVQTTTGSPIFSSNYTISVIQNAAISGIQSLLDQILFQDNKVSNTSGGGGPFSNRDYDAYFFHPLMLVRNQVGQGNYLMVIYMMDWWQPGTPITGTTSFTRNESVTIHFNYGL